jgi:hypothetical protein
MKLLFIVLLGLSSRVFAQQPNYPVWGSSGVIFTTAKMANYNSAAKKYGETYYNDARIYIDKANDPTGMTLNLDIPNKFFMKEGTIYSMDIKIGGDGVYYYSYTFLEDKKYVSLTFYYKKYEDNPYEILAICVDDFYAKTVKKSIFLLTEFK